MSEKRKIRVGLVFGGRSGEHEVSLASARSVMRNLDTEKYEVMPIAIDKTGTWLLGVEPAMMIETEQTKEQLEQQSKAVTLTGDPNMGRLIPLNANETLEGNGVVDVMFPVMHGTYGEDGTLQGLLEMANVPYVGCGVLGSALGMDKEIGKMVFENAGLSILPYVSFRRLQWERDPESIMDTVEQKLSYPCFVKPANLGSSVGINKASNRDGLCHAIQEAAEFDRKIVVEQGINCRELECGVLGNDEPLVSIVGEIVSSGEFFDYRAKYIDNRSITYIPADIPPEVSTEIRRRALVAFKALDLNGLARVDFFQDKDNGKIYINEVNTLPGFTETSRYPKLWAASGLPYSQLIDRMIELGIERHQDRQRNRTSI